jgi:branched-chain amino acid transport system ATP-binding protein
MTADLLRHGRAPVYPAASAILPLLVVERISLSFKGVRAISDVSFQVAEGEICAIIGPNGAGKSSMLNVINGLYRPEAGTIAFAGSKHEVMRPELAAELGVARTFQNIALFKGMSVIDNLLTGRTLRIRTHFLGHAFRTRAARREEREQRSKVNGIVELLGLERHIHATVGTLPYGLQKRVELGRALCAEPKMLLLDEPMAGMTFEEKREMCQFILDANAKLGTTIVLIEHDMGVVMDISDHVVVLDFGRVIADGRPEEVRTNQGVIDAYLGMAH